MQRLWDVCDELRDKHTGTSAAFDFNTLKHAIAGRDPVLEEAVAALEGDAQPVADLAPYYCTDCENHIRTLHEGRCSCGSGRVVATPPSPKLGVAVEALREIKRLKPEPIGDSGFVTGPAALLGQAQRIAREALSQLEKPGEDRDV